jgi:CHAT domain-containing protein/Tfp pilus assembly protein PilF
MTRRGRTASVVLGIVGLIVACPFSTAPNPTSGQELFADAKSAFQERTRLANQARKLRAAGKTAEAIAAAEALLKIERRVLPADDPELAAWLEWLAGLYIERADFAAAKTARQEALEILRKLHGEAHWKVTDARLALQDVERRAAMTGDQRQKLAEAERLNGEVLALERAGRYGDALQPARRTLAIRQELLGARHPDTGQSLNNLALLLEAQGDYAAARPLYDQALAIARAVLGPRHPHTAASMNNLALMLQAQGDYLAARPLLEQALDIYKAVLGPGHRATATSLNNLAELLSAQGDYAAARPLFEQALAIRKEVLGERHPEYASSLNNLAALLQAQGDYAAAQPLFEQALALCEAVLGPRHPHTAASMNNLAYLLDSQGDYAGARPLYVQVLALRQEVLGPRHPFTAKSSSNLAMLLWAQGDHAGAAPLLKQALEIAQGNLELAAAAQSERQQLAMAQALPGYLDAYLSVATPARLSAGDGYRFVLAAKGSIFERQRRLRAQRRRLQADPQSLAARQFAAYQGTVKRLATLALTTPDPRQAAAWREQVTELSRRKDELEAELARRDAGFRAARAEATRTPEQLRAALPRGTALIDLLGYTAYQPPAQGKGEFQRQHCLVAFLVRPDRPIARVDLGPTAPILRAIADWRPLLMSPRAAPIASDPARALRRLIWEPVEPHLDGIASVLVSPDGPIGLVPLAALPGKEPGRYLIEERSIAVVPVPRMLGSTVAAPAPRPGTSSGPSQPSPSLLLAGDIDYGGDPGTAADGGASRSAALTTRAGSLPDFRHLDATRGEILEVRDSFEEHFPDTRAQVLRGDKATEEAFRRQAPRCRYLHLATHGYFAPAQLRSALGPADPKAKAARPGSDALGGADVAGYHPGLLSGIAFAGANRRPTPLGQDDGILTALEVAELDLSAVELAVLSACETGLGEVAGGEGLLGLQRAFQVAGARSVVASLWKVDDEATRALMARFYENLWRKGLPAAGALREAQLTMLRGGLWRGSLERKSDGPKSDRLPPLYWAAFVLSTDQP